MVTIKKNVRESLGMRIGGGIGSNEGDTPIYVANIHPHGCIGKSKQMKVNTGGISAHIFCIFVRKRAIGAGEKSDVQNRNQGFFKKIILLFQLGNLSNCPPEIRGLVLTFVNANLPP